MNKKKLKNYILQNFDKIKINSKEILNGDIFVALPGNNNHGAIYINEALDRGAKYVITDTVIKKSNTNENIIVIKKILIFLKLIAEEKRNLFLGKVIGITGSIGKTSVKENLKFFLKDSYKVSVSIKSYNNFLGVVISLLNFNLASDYAIFEIGTNDFHEIRNLVKIIKPSQVIITNIYPTHLEKLINTKNIAKEKSDIFNPIYNKNLKLAILPNNNKDENFILKKAYKLKSFNILSFGKAYNSDIKISKIEYLNDIYSKIYLKYIDKQLNFVINNNQISRINNIMICFCIFIFNKIDLNIFSSLSRNIPLIEGRGLHQDIIIDKKRIKFIDESYNASPQSMKVTIDYFNDLKLEQNQKKYLILGDMKELGENSIMYHRNLIRYLNNKKLGNIIICGELMQSALGKKVNKSVKLMLDKCKILDYLKKNLSNNDIVLIKGSNSSITNDIAKDLIKKKDI